MDYVTIKPTLVHWAQRRSGHSHTDIYHPHPGLVHWAQKRSGHSHTDIHHPHPGLLHWAQEQSGHGTKSLYKKFPKLKLWETGEAKPTLKQMGVTIIYILLSPDTSIVVQRLFNHIDINNRRKKLRE